MSRVDVWIDDHSRNVFAFLVLGPIVIGAYPLTGLINPLWGSLFGFPLHIAFRYEHHPWAWGAAFLLWPIAVITCMSLVSCALLAIHHSWRRLVLGLWALSTFIVVPIDYSPAWLWQLPIYGAFM